MRNTTRILAENVTMSNDTWQTGINNNDLIVGPSGAGKTRGYVIPNILQNEESLIIADTKGNLRRKYESFLKENGFHVLDLNFKELKDSLHGYNPLSYIRRTTITVDGYDTTRYDEQDIITLSQVLCPTARVDDPFWEMSAQNYLQCLIAYTLNYLPEEEHTLNSLSRLVEIIGTNAFQELMEEETDIDENSFISKRYHQIQSNQAAERMESSIRGHLYCTLNSLASDDMNRFYSGLKQIDIKRIGREKTVLFLEVSDTDRSRDTLVNLFYTQAFHALCEEADNNFPDCRLKVPVRFILDDFATNTLIPHFDNLISVIRSREISVSLIVQSLSQLEDLYGKHSATTIVNNCDNMLYLGGLDIETANYVALKLNKTPYTVLTLPTDRAYLFTRGQEPRRVKKYNLENHPTLREHFPEKKKECQL